MELPMTRVPDPPTHDLSDEEHAALERDGVICVRGALDPGWTARLRSALDEAARAPTLIGRQISRPKRGMYQDMFVWCKSDAFRDIWYESPLAHYAGQAMRSERVNLFYEEIFYKYPGSTLPVPWHQDATAYPIGGRQNVNVWVTADPVTRASGGLEFVRGSHRWQRAFRVETAADSAFLLDSELAWCPDIERHRARYDILSWDMQPGDALVFGQHILHGSGQNHSLTQPRRAVVFRFAGDDAYYAPGRRTMPILYRHGLAPGAPIRGPLFPRLLPSGDEAERRPRDERRLRIDLGVMARNAVAQSWVELTRKLRPSRFRPVRSEPRTTQAN
jgi:ectoine hydroxylase-related dioxygenase (phytanoyl-CoA dioxygenase family)